LGPIPNTPNPKPQTQNPKFFNKKKFYKFLKRIN